MDKAAGASLTETGHASEAGAAEGVDQGRAKACEDASKAATVLEAVGSLNPITLLTTAATSAPQGTAGLEDAQAAGTAASPAVHSGGAARGVDPAAVAGTLGLGLRFVAEGGGCPNEEAAPGSVGNNDTTGHALDPNLNAAPQPKTTSGCGDADYARDHSAECGGSG